MGTHAQHHLCPVPIAGDFSDCLSMTYLVIHTTQIRELTIQQCGNKPEQILTTYGEDCLLPQKQKYFVCFQHVSYGESFNGRQSMRVVGHMVPKYHTSHHSSYPLCLNKCMRLIIQGRGDTDLWTVVPSQ